MPSEQANEAAIEEAVLLAQAGAGDREAFRLLYARYSGPLFSLAVRMLGDAGAAEEALQDTFVKIWHHAASYDTRKSRPFTWTVTIMRRTCIDQLRKREHRPVTAPLLVELHDATPDPTGRDSVREAAEGRDDSARLHGALTVLAPDIRQAVEFALFSGLTHSEIAQRLGQPVGTVKSWIRRGLLELRTTLNRDVP